MVLYSHCTLSLVGERWVLLLLTILRMILSPHNHFFTLTWYCM